MTLAWLVLQCLLCAAVIARAGWVLSHSADRIARATGLDGGWVGLALLATVTSLPELASGISAVTWSAAPDLAVGNALGACVFNLAFLVVVELLQRRQPLYAHASAAHLLSAAFGIVMLGLVALSLLLGERAPTLLHVGIYSPVLLALYLLALRSTRGEAVTRVRAPDPEPGTPPLSVTWRRFGVAALAVLVAGSLLPTLADQLGEALGWSRSFVGTLLMAVITTLPEVAVTVAALRLGALDMAVGNLLGSNLFNTAILAIDDAFYRTGPLLTDAEPVHAVTAVAAIVMTALVMIGLALRPRARLLHALSWVGAALLAMYVLTAALVFLQSG